MADVYTLYGETDGVNATGIISLTSQFFTGNVSEIKVDFGVAAKIFVAEISGKACDVILEVSEDDGSTWKPVKVWSLVSDGHLNVDQRKPIIIQSNKIEYKSPVAGLPPQLTPTTLFRFRYQQPTAGKTYITAVVEFDTYD